MSETKRLFLVDGSALAYRSYFAFIRNPLVNSKGEDTSAAFGFTRTIVDVLDAHRPDYLAVAFDTGGPTFRHEQFAEYKATRERMPEEMRDQLPRIREVLDALRIAVFEEEGFEADDVIGTLARRALDLGMDVVIVTGDKDFMQLVGPGIKLLSLRGRMGEEAELIDEGCVVEKFGVPPNRVTDVLGLMGDTSDNVPGVPKVGEKTAKGLVLEHGDLERVLAAAAEGPRKKVVEKNLVEFAEQARLSKDLVTIRTDAPVELSPDALQVGEPDLERLVPLLRDLEFSSLLEVLQGDLSTKEDVDYRIVTALQDLETMVDRVREAGILSVDLETTSVDPMRAEIVGISLAVVPLEAIYVPVGHAEGPNVDLEAVLEVLRPVLEDPSIPKVGQNIKYDTIVLSRAGVSLAGISFDTMLASYLVNPSEREHNLDAISKTYLNHRTTPISDLIGKGQKQIGFAEVPVDQAGDYACEDADLPLRLKGVLEPILKERELIPLFEEVEMPLVPVLAEMEMAGVAVDVAFLTGMSVELASEMERLVGEIYELAGETFNVNSTQQLARILFEKLGLKPRRKTKTGYSTDQSVLEALSHEHPAPQRLLEYRELMKLQSTYVDALPRLVHPETGRIHGSFNQAVTATGRLSSSDPNLQNIPVRTELGRRIREAFIPSGPEWVLLSADYSQIELRLMAHLSGDETLAEAFVSGEDIHRQTASLIFNLMPEFVTDDMRDRAKTVNFGVIYGMGAFGLSSRLGITVHEAQIFIDQYFATYPGVKAYIERTIGEARDRGYVTTMLGRRRYLPEIVSTKTRLREFAERTAVNTPVQGSASDMIKVGMIRIADRMKQEGLSAKMILQVHDELVFDVPETEAGDLQDLVVEEMVAALPLSVPVDVGVGAGRNWLEAH